jgi:hypothetical protein
VWFFLPPRGAICAVGGLAAFISLRGWPTGFIRN